VIAQSSILVGCAGDTVWIKVEGKGSFQNSGGLKELFSEMFSRGFRKFIVDLQKCPMMDSTFMGTLAGLALRLREAGGGSLETVNTNERNGDLLSSLGLDQLFAVSRTGIGVDPSLKREVVAPAESPVDQAQTMLEAHQALVEADPENFTKFKDVLEFLRQDLGRGT
jgi:anti-anti-sigma factor